MTGTKTSPEGQEKNDWVWIGKSRTDPYWQRCATHFDISTYENIYDAVADKLIHGPVRALVINGAGFAFELPTIVQTILSKELARSIFIYNPLNWPARGNFPFAGDLRVRKVNNVMELADLLAQISAETQEIEKTDQSALIPSETHPPIPQPEMQPVSSSEQVASTAENASEMSPVEEEHPAMPWPMEPPAMEPSSFVEPALQEEVETADEPISEISEKYEDEVKLEEREDALDLDKLSSKKDRKVSRADTNDAEISEGDFHLAQITSEELDALLGFEPDTKEHK
jgi:hypothetical protein